MKLHIGCGGRYIPGWIHVDARPAPHVDHVSQADDLSAFPDGSAEVLYACHVLEHMRREDYTHALHEFHRVLKPSGTLRVAVPNLREWCALYLDTGSLPLVHGSIFGRQDYEENTHFQGFDYDRLSDDLTMARFVDVRRYDWRKTEHAEVDDLSQTYIPHLDKMSGRLMSLNVEATR